MRKTTGTWYPLYCDDKCIRITLKGVWTPTKKGKCFCQYHAAMISTCKNCGKDFHSTRGHSETCSNACRVAHSRAKRIQCESVTGGTQS